MEALDIRTVTGGPIEVNTYVVGLVGGDHCVLIDPGAEEEDVKSAVGERCVDAVLLTHAHFDHMLYAKPWLSKGARLYVHGLDAPALTKTALNLSGMIGVRLVLPEADALLADGDIVKEADIEFSVLHTPGHTPGCVCYLCANTLFSGDTMFYGSYGRIDFPGGSVKDMMQSLARLRALDAETFVYPGHGMKTKIAWERGRFA